MAKCDIIISYFTRGYTIVADRRFTMQKMKVGVVGATGMVGQRFLTLLEDHPYFEVVALAASKSSAGKSYKEAVGSRWKLATPMPEQYKDMIVIDAEDVDAMKICQFVFCAVNMKKDEIKALEERYAKAETAGS